MSQETQRGAQDKHETGGDQRNVRKTACKEDCEGTDNGDRNCRRNGPCRGKFIVHASSSLSCRHSECGAGLLFLPVRNSCRAMTWKQVISHTAINAHNQMDHSTLG
jgi:hypothetical protein